jgi:putative hydrolase of the HAD superfamily
MLTLLGTEGTACIMVEDSARNLRPAKELGLTTILVDAEADEYVDFAVESVLEVGRVVDRLLGRR